MWLQFAGIPQKYLGSLFVNRKYVPLLPRVRSQRLNEGTVVAVHDMKAYAGNSGVVPLILDPTI